MASARCRRWAGLAGAIGLMSVLSAVAADGQERPTDAPAPPPRTKRILVIGDSWAAGMTFFLTGNAFQKTLDRNGWEHVQSVATVSANPAIPASTMPGSTAAQWAANVGGRLDLVRKILNENPTIDIVFMTLGANDLNSQALRRNLAQASAEERQDLWKRIGADIQKIVDALTAERPGLRLVLCGYDYFNLEANATSPIKLNFHGVTQEQYNGLFIELGRHMIELAGKSGGRIVYIHNFGINQRALGDSRHGYKVGELREPGGPPEYQPYPGGDPAWPSPAAAFQTPLVNDGFHLNNDGYARIIENALSQGMAAMLKNRTSADPAPPVE
jgi:lysophospholipase L1-like esterase